MNPIRFLLLTAATVLPIALMAGEPTVWPNIEGARTPEPNRMIAGQPDRDALTSAADAGVVHVVNARDTGEFTEWDESALVESLGMTYHHLPIGSADDLDREAVARFDAILAGIGDDPALLHCASGNRIGALYALRAAWIQGENAEAAVDIGRAHGLTRLESTVRQKITGNN